MRDYEFRSTFWKYTEAHSTELPRRCFFNHEKVCDLQCPSIKLKRTEEKQKFNVEFLCIKFDPPLYIDSVEIDFLSVNEGKTK